MLVPTFSARGCHVVSVTDPYGCILGFLDYDDDVKLFFLFGVEWNCVHYYWDCYWPIVPAPDDDECESIGGMLGRGNCSTRSKPAPVPLCPPQIPHDLIWPDPGWNPGRRGGKRPITCRSTAWPRQRVKTNFKNILFIFPRLSFEKGNCLLWVMSEMRSLLLAYCGWWVKWEIYYLLTVGGEWNEKYITCLLWVVSEMRSILLAYCGWWVQWEVYCMLTVGGEWNEKFITCLLWVVSEMRSILLAYCG
jgi:hypothetical protein